MAIYLSLFVHSTRHQRAPNISCFCYFLCQVYQSILHGSSSYNFAQNNIIYASFWDRAVGVGAHVSCCAAKPVPILRFFDRRVQCYMLCTAITQHKKCVILMGLLNREGVRLSDAVEKGLYAWWSVCKSAQKSRESFKQNQTEKYTSIWVYVYKESFFYFFMTLINVTLDPLLGMRLLLLLVSMLLLMIKNQPCPRWTMRIWHLCAKCDVQANSSKTQEWPGEGLAFKLARRLQTLRHTGPRSSSCIFSNLSLKSTTFATKSRCFCLCGSAASYSYCSCSITSSSALKCQSVY